MIHTKIKSSVGKTPTFIFENRNIIIFAGVLWRKIRTRISFAFICWAFIDIFGLHNCITLRSKSFVIEFDVIFDADIAFKSTRCRVCLFDHSRGTISSLKCLIIIITIIIFTRSAYYTADTKRGQADLQFRGKPY